MRGRERKLLCPFIRHELIMSEVQNHYRMYTARKFGLFIGSNIKRAKSNLEINIREIMFK